MNCEELVGDRVLAACGVAATEAFRDHASACATCREEVEEDREIRALYRDASRERLPFRPAVQRRRSRPPALRILAVAAAVLAAALVWTAPEREPAAPAADLVWEPTREAGGLVLDLDGQLLVERARVESACDAPSGIDVDLDDLKSRIDLAFADARGI